MMMYKYEKIKGKIGRAIIFPRNNLLSKVSIKVSVPPITSQIKNKASSIKDIISTFRSPCNITSYTTNPEYKLFTFLKGGPD